jgi:hypothetical protein
VIYGSPNDLYGDHTSARCEDSQVELVGICESLSATTPKLVFHPWRRYASSGCPGLFSRHGVKTVIFGVTVHEADEAIAREHVLHI